MSKAAVHIDDTVHEEPMHEWDRDNPDMSVGTLYPSMKEFRLAVRQHAIVQEFEYDTEHSDKDRFRKDRFSSGRIILLLLSCPNCTEFGHRAGSWKCPLTSTNKR